MEETLRLISCMGCEKRLGRIVTACSLLIEKNTTNTQLLFKPSIAQIAAEKTREGDKEGKFCALNGCASQCVNLLLQQQNIKPEFVITLPKLIKELKVAIPQNVDVTADLIQNPAVMVLSEEIEMRIADHFSVSASDLTPLENYQFSPHYTNMFSFTHTKFKFTIPYQADKMFYNWNDAWAYHIGHGQVVVGITDYLQKNLSDILMCEILSPGEEIGQFEAVASLESTKTVNEVLSPFSGTVVQVNPSLEGSPELLNEDPYHRGWVAILQTADFETECLDLMDGEAYLEFVREKVIRESEN